MPSVEPLSTTSYRTEFVSADLAGAIKEARKRKVVSKAEFYNLDFQNKLSSWTVSGDLDTKAIQGIQSTAATAINAGLSYTDFQKALGPQTIQAITAPRIVWRNAVSYAYQRGRFEQQNRVKALRPYLQYVTFGDENVRPNHRAMNGRVAQFDDPFWKANYPPNGHNCRCTAKSLTERQVKSQGLKVQTNSEIIASSKAEQLAAGVSPEKIVLPVADPNWKGSFALSPELGSYKQVQAFGKLPDPNTFFSFLTPSPLKIIKSETGAVVSGVAELATPAAAKIVNETGEQLFEDFVQVGPPLGSNPGAQFKDASGQKWYIKYLDEDHASNEMTAAKLYNLAGVEMPELQFVRRNGKKTVASKWIDGIEKNGALLTGGKVPGVAEGFGADAWIGNWDVVGTGYDNLQILGGRAIRVDAGGSLKYRATGPLKDPKFGPNVSELEVFFDKSKNPFSAEVLKNYTWEDLLPSLQAVTKIKKADVRKIVNSFMNGSTAEKKALYETLIARQEAIKEFAYNKAEELKKAGKSVKVKIATPKTVKEANKAIATEKKLQAEAAKKAAIQAEAEAAEAAKIAEKANVSDAWKNTDEGNRFERGAAKITKEDAADISKNKSIGYSIPSDGGDIEDQQIKFMELIGQGGEIKTKAVFKLRKDAFEDFVRRHGIDGSAGVSKPSTVQTFEKLKIELDEKFTSAIRSVNDKIKKGELIPASTVKKAEDAIESLNNILQPLRELQEAGAITAAEKTAFIKQYAEISSKLSTVKPGVQPFPVFDGMFNGFGSPSIKNIAKPEASGIEFMTQKNVVYRNDIKNGLDTETKDPSFTLGHYQRAKVGPASVKTYTDYKDNPTMFARIEIEVTGSADKAAKKIYKAMDELGINTTAPKFADVEELYLRQIAAKTNIHSLMDSIEAIPFGTENQAEHIAKIKNELNVVFRGITGKVDFEIDKLPDYNPIGIREGTSGNGRLIREIPKDATGRPGEWDEFRREHYLFQEPWTLKGKMEFAQGLENISNSAGKLISNYQKTLRGINIEASSGTGSADSDMIKGGAQNVFTRIKNREQSSTFRTGLVWDVDRARRNDAVSYYGDNYGKTIDNNVRKNRKFAIADLKENALNGSNETDFKDELDIWDRLHFIVAPNQEARKTMIANQKRRGITNLTNGRPIEDVVVVDGQSMKEHFARLEKFERSLEK